MSEYSNLIEFLRDMRDALNELAEDAESELRDMDNLDLSEDVYKSVVSKIDVALNGCDELIDELEAGSYDREDLFEEEDFDDL
jgi:hypothetical protein